MEAANFSATKGDPDQLVSTVLADLARERGMTVDELRQRILQAEAGASERIELAGRLLRANQAEGNQLKRIQRDAYKDLAAAARAKQQHNKALDYYHQALALTPRTEEAQEWASLQNSLGGCHWELGIRGEGRSATHRAEAFMREKRFDATLIHTHTFAFENLIEALRYARDRVEDAIKVVVAIRA